jgi:hypothetical protein
MERGADVGEICHIEPGKGPVPGLDPQRRSYFSRASFADPDGNRWVFQEITERLPGGCNVFEWDIGAASDLGSADNTMAILKATPDLIFPFGVRGGAAIELDAVLQLDHVRWPRDNGKPVLITQADTRGRAAARRPSRRRSSRDRAHRRGAAGQSRSVGRRPRFLHLRTFPM